MLRQVSPAVTPEQWQQAETIVGIKMSLNTVSFAALNKSSRELLSWGHAATFQGLQSFAQAEFQHPKMYCAGVAVAEQIPEADLYFVEEPARIIGAKDTKLRMKVLSIELNAILTTLLNQKRLRTTDELAANRVHRVKYPVKDALLGSDGIGEKERSMRLGSRLKKMA